MGGTATAEEEDGEVVDSRGDPGTLGRHGGYNSRAAAEEA